MKKSMRVLCLVLCVLCLFVLACSLSLGCNESHDCSGEACAVCLVVSMREMLANLLFVAVLAFLATLACVCTVPLLAVCARCPHISPVLLKVKLSD